MSVSASQQRWTAVDQYLSERLVPPDPGLDGALRDSEAADLSARSS